MAPKDGPKCLTSGLDAMLEEIDVSYDLFKDYLEMVKKAFQVFQTSLSTIHADLERRTVLEPLSGTKHLVRGVLSNTAGVLFLNNIDGSFSELESSKAKWEEEKARIQEEAKSACAKISSIYKLWIEAASKEGSITLSRQQELAQVVPKFREEAENARKLLDNAITLAHNSRAEIAQCVSAAMGQLATHLRFRIPPIDRDKRSKAEELVIEAMEVELDLVKSFEECLKKGKKESTTTPTYMDLQTVFGKDVKARLAQDYEVDGRVISAKTEVDILSADYRKMWRVKADEGLLFEIPCTILEWLK